MGKTGIDRRWLPLNALRAFEGVAKHSSFTAAANALLISQSALSRHVISLEKLIGAQLFERRPHALVLTKAGQLLLPAVIKSFDRLEYALDDIRNEGLGRGEARQRRTPGYLRFEPRGTGAGLAGAGGVGSAGLACSPSNFSSASANTKRASSVGSCRMRRIFSGPSSR